MKRLYFILVLWAAKFGNVLCRIFRKTGSTVSGAVAVRLQKDFVRYFWNIDYDKVVFVTGTNGKSTTTNLIAHTLAAGGKSVAVNKEGANMMSGVATTLIRNSDLTGKLKKEFLVLEIDERSFRYIVKVLPAKNLCITNLQKDQVQRNGDPDFIYRMFKRAIDRDVALFLNNEEPRSRSLEDCVSKPIYFSMDKNERSFSKNDFYDVTMACPRCGHKLEFAYYNLDNIGKFCCTGCGYQSLKQADVSLYDIDYDKKTFWCKGELYHVPDVNSFSLYNYALTIAVCRKLRIKTTDIRKGFATFHNPANRPEIYRYKGKTIRYLRMKQENPDTMQNALDIVSRDPKNKAIWIGLYEVKDFVPAYTNTFYFFDCDFAKCVDDTVEEYVCFSRTVAYDTANRMLYAGVPEEKIKIYDADDDFERIFEDLNRIRTDNVYLITGVRPYKKISEYLKRGKSDGRRDQNCVDV